MLSRLEERTEQNTKEARRERTRNHHKQAHKLCKQEHGWIRGGGYRAQPAKDDACAMYAINVVFVIRAEFAS